MAAYLRQIRGTRTMALRAQVPFRTKLRLHTCARCGAMFKAFKKYIFIFITDKQIYPVYDSKGYKIQLILIPEFILAAHGLKLIEKEQSCKKVSCDQNYFKAQVPIRTKLWLHTCARCRARCGGKLFLGRVKEQKFIKNYRPNILELMTVPYARSRELI